MLSCCVNVLRVLSLSPLFMCAQFCSPNGVMSSHTPPPLPPMARPASLCCGFSSEWKLFNRGCVLYAEILDVTVKLYELQPLWRLNKAFYHLMFQGQRSQDNHFFFYAVWLQCLRNLKAMSWQIIIKINDCQFFIHEITLCMYHTFNICIFCHKTIINLITFINNAMRIYVCTVQIQF